MPGIRGVVLTSNPACYQVFSASGSFCKIKRTLPACVCVLSGVMLASDQVAEVDEIPLKRRRRSVSLRHGWIKGRSIKTFVVFQH